MNHKEVYEQFTNLFPTLAGEKVAVWFTNGKNSIRVRETDGQELIFSIIGKNEWTMESPQHFMKRMRAKA